MPQLWLFRHGETAWTISGRHTGRTDIPLTARGESQARLLSRRIGTRRFALVLTSPLSRARETCRLAGLASAAQVEPDLAEWDYGALEGRTNADIRKEHQGWTIWTGPVPGGEAPEQVGARVDRVLARVSGIDDDVAIFAHGHLLRVLAARWLGLPPQGGRYLALDPASLCVLGHEHGNRVVRRWNEGQALLEDP